METSMEQNLPLREKSLTIRLSAEEQLLIFRLSLHWGMNRSATMRRLLRETAPRKLSAGTAKTAEVEG